jgi:hypothetical protein
VRCGNCGRVSSDSAIFCESCGSRLGMPQYEMMSSKPVSLQPAKKDIKMPLAMMILGIVIVIVGIIIYAWAMSDAIYNAADANPNDPFGSMDPFMTDLSAVMASYATMAIGGIVFIVGLVLLILKIV